MIPEAAAERCSCWGRLAEQARAECAHIPVGALLGFQAYLAAEGSPPTATGPDILALWAKSPLHAAVARQHRPSGARDAFASLVEGGQGPQAHAAAARDLAHPFADEPAIERDLRYAIEASASMGPAVEGSRDERLAVLRSISRAVRPLDQELLARRHESIEGAPGVRPVFVAMLVALLAWPDTGLPQALAL